MKKLSFLDNGIAQIAYVVKDLDRVVENYYKHFGIAPWHFYTYEKPFVRQMSRHGKPASYRMRVALSYFGTTFKLIERPKGRKKPERIYPPENRG